MSKERLADLQAAATASLKREYDEALGDWRTATDTHGVNSPEAQAALAAAGQKDGEVRAAKNPLIS